MTKTNKGDASDLPVFKLHRGSAALLISLPHVGVEVPQAIRERLLPRALGLEDTDWHLERLYAFAAALGASMIVPRFSRYVIDLNRPPENTPMYPGANNTALCPTRFFSGDALYRQGQEPDDDEIDRRREQYWLPYHRALEDELSRIEAVHGHAVLFDAHSIRSELPWLFEGRLDDLNLGTANGASCAPSLRTALVAVCARQTGFSHVVDGRFKGGHITRRHGQPAAGRHAVQLEMTWRCYMREESPFEIEVERAATLEPVLRELVRTMLRWRPDA